MTAGRYAGGCSFLLFLDFLRGCDRRRQPSYDLFRHHAPPPGAFLNPFKGRRERAR
jgi:hypothetical protein